MTPLTLHDSLTPTDRLTNEAHFREAKYQPDRVLEAQRNLWLTLRVQGAKQYTLPENFLIIGEPYKDDDGIYSKIFNQQLLKPYKEPSLTMLNSNDTCANVKKLSNGTLVWKHSAVRKGKDEDGNNPRKDAKEEVRTWYQTTDAEAKGGRILFNLHRKGAWESLFHEPVHEAAPAGGIGTNPRWTFEGYCEIFAKLLADSMGHTNYNIQAGPYGSYATEMQKLVRFTSQNPTSPSAQTYVARAYFLNDEWSYSLLAPLFYKKVLGHDISGNITNYIPTENEVPGMINDLLVPVRRPNKPEWYKRWVRLFGRVGQMPELPQVGGGLGRPGGPGGLGRPGGPGGLGRPGGPNIQQPNPLDTTETLTLNSYMSRFWAVDN